jgi:hypothetical protein
MKFFYDLILGLQLLRNVRKKSLGENSIKTTSVIWAGEVVYINLLIAQLLMRGPCLNSQGCPIKK